MILPGTLVSIVWSSHGSCGHPWNRDLASWCGHDVNKPIDMVDLDRRSCYVVMAVKNDRYSNRYALLFNGVQLAWWRIGNGVIVEARTS